MHVLVIVLMALTPVVFAATASTDEYYRSTDKHGNPSYSDAPATNAEEQEPLKLPPTNYYDPSPAQPAAPGAVDPAAEQRAAEIMERLRERAEEAAQYQVAITYPANEQAVRANSGNLKITASVQPALRAGHRLHLIINGQDMGTSILGIFDMEHLDRGEHRVQVQVRDQEGKVQATSEAVTFYMLRHSLLFRSRQSGQV